LAVDGERHGYAKEPVAFAEKAVVTQLVPDKQSDQNTASEADSQSHNIDERVAFVFEQISGGDFEVVFEHGNS
jgi:hypothetical protein